MNDAHDNAATDKRMLEKFQAKDGAHTPGPWAWEMDASHRQQTLVAGGAAVVLHLDRRNRNTVGVNPEDARLIAAAPRMEEALQFAADRLGPQDGGPLDIVRAEIRVALGGKP